MPLKVLLVGANTVGLWPLTEHLKQRGYQCEYASTCLDGARLIACGSFDLVVCSVRVKGFELLLTAARHSSASLFRYVLVEDGCWWVPCVLRGESRSNARAFREAEFDNALDTMAKELQSASPRAHAAGADEL